MALRLLARRLGSTGGAFIGFSQKPVQDKSNRLYPSMPHSTFRRTSGSHAVSLVVLRVVTATFLSLIHSYALGVEPDERLSEEIQLLKEETVITPLRNEQPISRSPSNVYVLTDDDIRHSGATDLPTLLRRIPGMEVMQMNGADFNVSARGNNQILANKLLVMVDGRSIYNDFQGFVFWKGIPVTLPEIKRIEVVKGPTSAVYGFNAFDGVVHIITKSPEEMKGNTVQVGAGEVGTLTSSAIHAGSYRKLGYRLSAGWDQNQQWDHRDRLAFRSYKFNLQTEYALAGQSRVLFSGGLVDMNRFEGPFVGNVLLSSDVHLPYASASYERPNFFVRSFWSGFYATSEALPHPLLGNLLRFTDPQGSDLVIFRGDTYNVEAQHTVELGKTNRLIYGANYRYNGVSCNCTAGFQEENRLGFYVHDEWRLAPALTMVAGFRYDLHTEIHNTFSPRLGPARRMGEWDGVVRSRFTM
jgi:iron complex outermembrane receptor protein